MNDNHRDLGDLVLKAEQTVADMKARNIKMAVDTLAILDSFDANSKQFKQAKSEVKRLEAICLKMAVR